MFSALALNDRGQDAYGGKKGSNILRIRFRGLTKDLRHMRDV